MANPCSSGERLIAMKINGEKKVSSIPGCIFDALDSLYDEHRI